MERPKRKLIWSPDSETDLIGICSYCEDSFGLLVALDIMSEYEFLANVLSGQPQIGMKVQDSTYLGMEMRVHPLEWSRIFYSHSETEVHILRIFDVRIHPGDPRP